MLKIFMFGKKAVDMYPEVSVALSVPGVPAVSVSTSVIAETPVSQEIALSVPSVPTISISTSVS